MWPSAKAILPRTRTGDVTSLAKSAPVERIEKREMMAKTKTNVLLPPKGPSPAAKLTLRQTTAAFELQTKNEEQLRPTEKTKECTDTF